MVAIRSCDAKWKPASRPRIATGKLFLLAGPEASFPCPGPEPRPGSFSFLRGLKLPSRAPAPNRDREAFSPCGAWSFLPAPRPRTATGKLFLLAGPGTSFPRPGPESRPGSFSFLQGLELPSRAPAPNRDREAFPPCGAWSFLPAPRPRIATGKLPGNSGLTLCIQVFPCHSVYRDRGSSVLDTEHPRKAPPLSVSQPGSSYSIHCVYKILPLFSVSRPEKLCPGH